MSLNKRIALIFLTAINIMNIIAGGIVQIKMITDSDVSSIIPVPTSAELTVNQVLMLNFMSVTAIMLLICVVATYITTDVAYTPIEILSNLAGIFLILPAILLAIGVFNTIRAELSIDKITIIICSIIHFISCAVNVCCVLTVKEDAEN